jgi:hypothetical protein
VIGFLVESFLSFLFLPFFKKKKTKKKLRKPRIVRIGAIQNTTVLPTSAPFADQYAAIEKKIEIMIEGTICFC